MAILKNTVIADSDPISLPMGTTAQRPVNPPEGSMRYNTDLGYTEVWINRSWGDLANGRASFLPRNNMQVELSYDDPASWPGSGSTWFDTSGNDNDFRVDPAWAEGSGTAGAWNFSNNGDMAKYKTNNTNVPGVVGNNNVTYVVVTRVLNSTSQWRTLTRGFNPNPDHHVIIESGGWNIGMYDNDGSGFLNTGYSQQRLPAYPDGYQVMVWRWSTADTASMPTYTININGAAGGIYTASFNNSAGRYNNSFHSIGGYHSQNSALNTGDQPWGWIKYFAAYSRRLEDNEVQMVTSTLRNRYGI